MAAKGQQGVRKVSWEVSYGFRWVVIDRATQYHEDTKAEPSAGYAPGAR